MKKDVSLQIAFRPFFLLVTTKNLIAKTQKYYLSNINQGKIKQLLFHQQCCNSEGHGWIKAIVPVNSFRPCYFDSKLTVICCSMRQLDLSLAIMYIITGLIIDEIVLVLFSLQMSGVSMVIYLGNHKGHLNAATWRSAFHHGKCIHFLRSFFFLLEHEQKLKCFYKKILKTLHNPVSPSHICSGWNRRKCFRDLNQMLQVPRQQRENILVKKLWQ